MSRFSLTRLVSLVAFLVASAGVSRAMAAPLPPCSDGYITAAFVSTVGRAPVGSGQTGECNPNLYVGSNLPMTQANSVILIPASKLCPSDPWIGEIYVTVIHRKPTAQECSIQLYGNGHWANNVALIGLIQNYTNQEAALQKAPQILTSQIWISNSLEVVNTDGLRIPNGQYRLMRSSVLVTPHANELHTLTTGTWSTSHQGNIVWIR